MCKLELLEGTQFVDDNETRQKCVFINIELKEA